MLVKGMVKLPKVADPSVAKGKWKNQFCMFHRAMGHDTEHCFFFKNVVQDCIDRELLMKDKEESQPVLSPTPSSATQEDDDANALSFLSFAFAIFKGAV